MSDTEQEPEPVRRPPRRHGRVIGVMFCMCVLALFLVLALWAVRPRWHTFISTPVTPAPPILGTVGTRVTHLANTPALPIVALALRIPSGWECRQLTKPGSAQPLMPGSIWIEIRREPLTGLARWWSEHVLHLKSSPPPSEVNMIRLSALSSDWGSANVQQIYQAIYQI